MKLLTFQARRFRWKSFSKTLPEAEDLDVDETVEECVVVFLHAEERDAAERASVFKKALKHVKWLANKRGMQRVVLHSFTHLGAASAAPEFARARSWWSSPSACERPAKRLGSRPSAGSASGTCRSTATAWRRCGRRSAQRTSRPRRRRLA
jgi:hypothetical protein